MSTADGLATRAYASWTVLALGVVAAVVYLGTQPAAPSFVAYDGMAFVAPAAVGFVVWRYRPPAHKIWLLFGLGLFLDFIGEVLWDLGWDSAGSVPDLAYFAGYVIVAASLLAFARAASQGGDVDDVLDLLIVAAGLALLVGEFLVEPAVASSGELLARVSAIAYPVVGVALLLTALRVLVNPARRVPALYLIVAAIAIRFITDIVYSIQILHDGYTEGTVLDIGWIVAFACFAAGALHPSMPAIGAGAVRYVKGDGRVRLVIIGVAGVTIPIVVSLASVTRGQLDLWEPLAVAVLDTLVVMRVARLFRRRVRAEASLSHQALHDALTGLPNRVLFLDRAELALTRSTRNGTTSALLFLDLDRFKVVNDSMGHRTGDQLLVDVAARLSGCARAGDTVARFGGDEFAILCENLTDERAAMTMAARVVAALEPSFAIETESVVMTASIGVAISRPGCTADDLLRDADAAMYRAKDNGRDRFEMFDDAMRALAVERMTIEQELRLAITREEIVVYYQPAVQLTSGDTVGFEALVRWVHPTRGLLFPGEFLEVAEETGIIHALGDIVIEQVVKDLASPERAPGLVGRWVAVNVSVRQLTDGDLVASIASALARHDVLSSRLCIEITEHALARDPARASATLEGLGALGVQIAVDDFGTGYSSLTYLQRYPVDVLKIDQSFVDNVGTDPDDTAIVNAVITLGHSLGLVVLAEGVERSDQARALRAAGCDLAQGFLYGGAVPVHHLPVREFVSGPLAS